MTEISLIVKLYNQFTSPQVENVFSVSPASRKGQINGAVSRNIRIKRVAPCRCLDGHVKEPYEMSTVL